LLLLKVPELFLNSFKLLHWMHEALMMMMLICDAWCVCSKAG
jgi:hypothetical protein